jgi:hypothetical protein
MKGAPAGGDVQILNGADTMMNSKRVSALEQRMDEQAVTSRFLLEFFKLTARGAMKAGGGQTPAGQNKVLDTIEAQLINGSPLSSELADFVRRTMGSLRDVHVVPHE